MKVCITIDRNCNWVVANDKSPCWADRLPSDEVRDASCDEIKYFQETGYSDFNFSEWELFWNEKKVK